MAGDTAGTKFRWWQRWPAWAAYAAGAWSLAYGVLGLYWALGGAGFPFGENDPNAAVSVLGDLRAEVGAPVIAALGLVGALVAVTMARTWRHSVVRGVLLTFAWTVCVTLLLVIPDFRVLSAVAYAPILLIGALFDWPPGANLRDAFPWLVVNQFICIGGGFLWGIAALAYQRQTQGACAYCGRTATGAPWTRPAAAARWGKWAVYVAVIVPILYAVTRYAWALGIPLGITEEFLREFLEVGQAGGLWVAGAGLATVAVGGALLTLGLIQRWGEIFPRWMPGLAGKRVPPALAIVPATLVSVIVTVAGLMFVRLQFRGILGDTILGDAFGEGNWATTVPELLWPIWGVALGAATLAYYYRRRSQCRHCGRL